MFPVQTEEDDDDDDVDSSAPRPTEEQMPELTASINDTQADDEKSSFDFYG